MKGRASLVLILLAAVATGRAAEPARAAPGETLKLVRLPGGAIATAPQPFAFRSEEVTVEGTCAYDPVSVEVHFAGTYRTRQSLDPASLLSYQVYDETGRKLQGDGLRFAWTPDGAGLREARFAAAIALPSRRDAVRALVIQFNYVVEHQFWYRDRFPGMLLPALRVEGLPRTTHHDVRWTFIPPVLPADTLCRIPVRVRAVYRDDGPVGFAASLDGQADDRRSRIESARIPLPPLKDGRGEFWQIQELQTSTVGMVWLRPGFVLEDVRWYQEFEHNPYHRVLLVGPLVFVAGASLAGLGLGLIWQAAGWLRGRWLRRTVRVATLGASVYLGGVLWVAGYLALAVVVLLLAWLAQRRLDASRHAYWATLLFLLLLELYWGHVSPGYAVAAKGTLFSVSVTALILLPLLAVRQRAVAGGLLVAITLLATVTAIAMSIYYRFFFDYPSVTTLLYAGQAEDLQDSIGALWGQSHLVPLWLWAAVPLSLVIRGRRARADRAGRESPGPPGIPSPAAR